MIRKAWIRAVLLVLPVIFVIACVLLRDFALHLALNVMPPCDSYSAVGIYCPGCGLTRCILAVMDGDIWLAVRSNAAISALFLCVTLLYIELVLLSFGKDVRILPRKAWFWILFGICAAAYIVLRNFIPVLQPPPLIG